MVPLFSVKSIHTNEDFPKLHVVFQLYWYAVEMQVRTKQTAPLDPLETSWKLESHGWPIGWSRKQIWRYQTSIGSEKTYVCCSALKTGRVKRHLRIFWTSLNLILLSLSYFQSLRLLMWGNKHVVFIILSQTPNSFWIST